MLLHATGTLDEIISHVTIFPATGKDIKDKKLKAKPVPNSLSVFVEKKVWTRKIEQAMKKRDHCAISTDYIKNNGWSKIEMTVCEKVQLVLDTIEQQGQILGQLNKKRKISGNYLLL